jgi:hypothetical protein
VGNRVRRESTPDDCYYVQPAEAPLALP